MKRKIISKCITLSALTMLSAVVYATPTGKHQVVAPRCLTEHLSVPYQTLAQSQSMSLIEVNASGIDQLVEQKHLRKCGGFMDVSHAWQTYSKQKPVSATSASNFLKHYVKPTSSETVKPRRYKIQFESVVNDQLKRLNPQAMWGNLTTLSSYPDRYADSDNGVKTAAWLKSQIEQLAKDNHRNDITVRLVPTGEDYRQPSVVVKMGNSNEAGVVLGGHMDTLASSFEIKPGADDDGTGSTTVLETARILISSGLQFKKPIYFVFYAAEEMGLVGSQYVVADFVEKKIPVDAVMQLDMTGYSHKNDPTMWIYKDYVSKSLNKYIESLITTYVKQPFKYTACGYACSDHASWTAEGFASAMPSEASFDTHNPSIHSANDTMDKLSINHMNSFAKLAIAFAIELGEPVG